jgi:hypothetical protein
MKKKWWWLAVLVGAIAVVVYLMRSPANGKITYQTAKSPTPSPMEYIRYDAPDFSFAYENKYELRQNGLGWELVGNQGVSSHFVITLNPAKSGDIEDISGVLMRRLKPDEYSESTISWGETSGVLFKRNDSFELTAFFLKDGKAVTVSMTANSNDETGLQDEFQKLVDSMEIK